MRIGAQVSIPNIDYGKTLEISTRCGQDSDCNPASAGGILGTVTGYCNIPEKWKKAVYPVEDMNFKYTTMSLNDVYATSYKHALGVLESNGAEIDRETIEIPVEPIEPVHLEVGFEGHYPTRSIEKPLGKTEIFVFNGQNTEYKFEFQGNGCVANGWAIQKGWTWFTRDQFKENHNVLIDVFINGELIETAKMPTEYRLRKEGIAWAFNLPEQNHEVYLVLKNPSEKYEVILQRVIIYHSSTK